MHQVDPRAFLNCVVLGTYHRIQMSMNYHLKTLSAFELPIQLGGSGETLFAPQFVH